MFNGALVPAALARRKPGPEREPLSRPLAMQVSPMPRGVIDVETEIRNALTALGDIARIRCIELQMVVEPDLTAEADLGCQACLREVLAAAIGRAESSIWQAPCGAATASRSRCWTMVQQPPWALFCFRNRARCRRLPVLRPSTSRTAARGSRSACQFRGSPRPGRTTGPASNAEPTESPLILFIYFGVVSGIAAHTSRVPASPANARLKKAARMPTASATQPE